MFRGDILDNQTVSCKCPNCGGELVFDAGRQVFACEWCGSDFSSDEMKEITAASPVEISPAENAVKEESERQFADDTDVYICSSCGAEIICDHNTAASFCCYCHNPVTLSDRLYGNYRPEKLIPFKLDREKALELFKKHCSKKWFLPSDFLSDGQMEKMTGLYVPFWLADCNVDAAAAAEGRIVRSYTRGNTTYTNTKIFNVERCARMQYDGIPADGSSKIDDSLMDAVEPFDYSALIDFDMSYLSGFYCDKYDVSKSQVIGRIKNRVDEGAEKFLRDDMKGYTTVSSMRKNIRILGMEWHYMTLPVWFMNYKHGGKFYSFAMNGQTGKIVGSLPVSAVKLSLFAAVVAVCCFILGYMIGGTMG